MKTTLLTPETDENAVKTAAELIRAGEVVGMPTETVYGLAANALNGEAVKKIFLAKGRPQDNPLIVHIADFDQIYDLCPAVPPQAKLLADAFWPGPLTMIVPKGDCIPDEVSCGLDTVGIRLPSHPMARALIRESGVPLAAPSANTSGRPSTTTAAHVMHDMDGKIAAVLDGGACGVGVESTVITLALDTAFGGVTDVNGVLDRPKLAKIVFSDPAKLQQLNEITTPYIRKASLDAIHAQSACPIVLYDAPTLFEAGADDFCDKIIAVLAPHDTRVARIIERDGLSNEAARARIDAQPNDMFYREKCDFIIENNGDLDMLYRDTDALYSQLIK